MDVIKKIVIFIPVMIWYVLAWAIYKIFGCDWRPSL